jgi:nucleotide-binding universal stress UspA family protein
MTIVVGLTARPESQAALRRAIQEAELRGADLHIVQTIGESIGENPGAVPSWTEGLENLQERGDRLVEELREKGVAATFRLEQARSDPARLLLDVAKDVAADLIVIGIRRRSPVGKLVLGSASQGVLLGADCPVLAVKASTD